MKRILLLLLVVIAVAQFIQPDRSVPASDASNDLLVMTSAPDSIRSLVVGACYDCHSDKTDYPWYAYITPVNFILQRHINEGREVLNYSRWNEFAGTEEAAESGEAMAEGEMPPGNYTWMHGHARLTDAQRQTLITWFDQQVGTDGGSSHGTAKHGSDEEDGEEHD